MTQRKRTLLAGGLLLIAILAGYGVHRLVSAQAPEEQPMFMFVEFEPTLWQRVVSRCQALAGWPPAPPPYGFHGRVP